MKVMRPGVLLALMLGGLGVSGFAHSALAQEQEQPPRIKVESSNPFSGDPEAIKAGAKTYFKHCVQCHGVHADGNSRFGAYAYDLRRFWRGYAEFVAIVVKGRPEKQMPPWGPYLNGNEIAQIGAFLETLAIEGARWK